MAKKKARKKALPKLLPCPFCGGEAFYDYGPSWDRSVMARCGGSCEVVVKTLASGNERYAARDWNTRNGKLVKT